MNKGGEADFSGIDCGRRSGAFTGASDASLSGGNTF